MKPRIVAAILTGAAASNLSADNLIWSDNFNVPDSGSFDAASLATGRRGGFFPTEIEGRSANAQHQILSQQLRLAGGSGRVRFEVPPGGAPIVSYNWAAGSAGAQILSGGGIRVEFDYVSPNNTSGDWVSFSIGFPSSSILAEPGGFRLNDANTDFGFLLRANGGSQFFKNGPGTNGGNFPATTTSRHVVVQYGFTGLADLDPFTVVVTVDGTEVINQAHSWSNNSGQLLFELGGNLGASLVDNFQVFELTPTRLQIALDDGSFESSFAQGDDIGTLSALLGGVPGGADYTLVSGTGDTDNGKFQITGDKLEIGTFSFIGANSTEGQQFSVRVRGTSTGIGAQTDEQVLVLTVVKDDDSDGILDAWEIAKAGNITTLSGDDVSDVDGDGLTDLEEYKISLGTSVAFPVTFANINPTLADSDSDGLEDREELEPGYELVGNLRPPTDPTLADTDADGLSDLSETNTFTYVSPTDTGSNPTLLDSDLDGLGDGFETTNNASGYDPNVDDSNLDTDGDGLLTIDEVFYGTSVISTDTDGDSLLDNEEVFALAGSRPATNPTLADTDFDGLSDLVETNTTVFVNASDTGTDPTINDTDLDGSRDGVEVAAGTSPLLATERPDPPAGVALVKVTDDASTGISTGKTYTHKISGGGAVTINGVVFDVLTNVLTPTNFDWTPVNATNNPSRDFINDNNGDWIPATGGVTGAGLLGLFDSFAYAGNGAAVGTSKQTYTLSGLTPGESYQLRIYIRMWDDNTAGSGRPVDLVFKNGAEPPVRPFQGLYEDRADIMLETGNLHDAYYLSFDYVAQGPTLVIDAEIPANNLFINDSGSFHLYGLTNELTSEPSPVLAITGASRSPLGDIIINFTGEPNTIYNVTKSPDLTTPFGPLTTPLTATTNGSGLGQATIPASEASEAREFYRIEE
jgi:hypothetical protein